MNLDPSLKIFKMYPDVEVPVYAKAGDAGMDVRAYFGKDCVTDPDGESYTLHPGQRALITTGLKLGIPEGMMITVCSRSGLAANFGIISLISPGIIDSGYRGELKVCLYNSGSSPFNIFHGDRIAQLILQHTPKIPTQYVTEESQLGESDRGFGGFGSTGDQ